MGNGTEGVRTFLDLDGCETKQNYGIVPGSLGSSTLRCTSDKTVELDERTGLEELDLIQISQKVKGFVQKQGVPGHHRLQADINIDGTR